MPAVSAKQKKLMDAAAHNPEFAKKAGVPKDVAKEYSEASKGQKFGTGTRPKLQRINKPKTDHGSMNLFNKGGIMKDIKQDKAMAKKAVGMHESQLHGGKKSDMSKLKKGGMPMVMKDGKKVPAFAAKKGGMTKMANGGSASSRADGCAVKGKTKGMMVKMNKGGMSC
jgi:hypothetical protein